MTAPRVAIIILNWNGWKDTIECLESLYQINYPNYDVILVDNASKDDSIERIHQYCNDEINVYSPFFEYSSINKPIELLDYTKGESETLSNYNNVSNELFLIKNDLNYGFAKGNNIGIRFALKNMNPDYVLLLNNDTVVDKTFLREMVKYAENNQKIGIIGPKIYYYDMPNKIQVTQTKINMWLGRNSLIGEGELDMGQYNEILTTDYVPGSCFLVKREVIKDIGLLNEDFNCYWEESDYCMSAKKQGYECIYNPNSMIWHKVSKSTNKVTGTFIYYITRNMFWFMKRQATTPQYIVFLLFNVLKFLYVIIGLLISKRYDDISFFSKGFKDGIIPK